MYIYDDIKWPFNVHNPSSSIKFIWRK